MDDLAVGVAAARHLSRRWDLAWTGFDIGLAACFAGTAIAAWRRSPSVGAFAAATGTLLLADAWFDIVLESRGAETRLAIVEAVFAELPVAALCFWIAHRTERFLALAVDVALGRETRHISRRPVRARPRVTSSAYSRSPPTGRPLARRVTRTRPRRRSARNAAVASPVMFGLVASTTS